MSLPQPAEPALIRRFPVGDSAGDPARSRRRRVAERAKALATGLARYAAPGEVPRALAEAHYLCDESHNGARPLLERIRILGLMATSLDQFCVEHTPALSEEDGPRDALDWAACAPVVSTLLQRAARLLRVELLPALAQERGALLRQPAMLTREQRIWLRTFFQAQIFPLLTPLAIDPGHPFPFISSYSLNFLVQLRGQKAGSATSVLNYARIKVPRLLSRFVEVPLPESRDSASEHDFLWSEEIVRFFLPELFPGLSVENAYLFRVLRPNLVPAAQPDQLDPQPVLHQRHLLSSVARLDVEADMPGSMLTWLTDHLGVPAEGVYRIDGHMALFQLTDLVNLVEGNDAVRVLI